MADSPAVGSPAPDFTLSSHTGETVSLRDFRGKQPVVLFFYPKADTPGCTREACGFRDAYAEFQRAGAAVLGISPDPAARQSRFAAKYDLSYPLLADPDHRVAEAYGVWGEKKMMGRQYMGVIRTTFLIDRDGILRGVYSGFDIDSHPREMLDAVKAIG